MELSKKECILGAACKIFSRFGFKKTSVNEIAESAGVAKGTVYLACESKEDLFYQVLNREVREWISDASKAIDPREKADRLLAPVLISGLELLESRPLVRDLLAGNTYATMPGWEDRLDELRALARSHVVELLRQGIKQGVFRQSLDVEAAARSLQDLMISAFQFPEGARAQSSAKARDLVGARLRAGLDLVVHGLRG